MIKRTLEQIAVLAGGRLHNEADAGLPIQGIVTDTRKEAAGALFIPLAGENFDGHDYVEEALRKGAAAAMWQQDRPNPPLNRPLLLVDDPLLALQRLAAGYRKELPVRVIGVTGSNGKTTTKDMIAAILATTYRVHKTVGNLNNHIGVPLTLLAMDEQTEMAVIEMGMSGYGEIELLSKLAAPEVAIITTIGESHMLQLGSRKGIAVAKLEIVSGLKPDGLLVYNGDDPLLLEQLKELGLPQSLLTFRFGIQANNDFSPTTVMFDSGGTHFKLSGLDDTAFYIPLLGVHNVVNAMSAIAVAKFMGVNEKDIASGLQHMVATGMRIEIVKSKTGLTVLNDAYNSSPTSLRAALALLADLKGYRRKIAIIGDMLELGPEEISYHAAIGEQFVPEEIDYLFTFGALAEQIARAALLRYTPGRIQSFESKPELLKAVAAVLHPQDVVLVKGSRGMKMEEVVNGLQSIII